MKKRMPLWMLMAAYSMALLIVVLYRLGGPGEMALFMICVPLLFVWYWLQTESVGMLRCCLQILPSHMLSRQIFRPNCIILMSVTTA